MRKYLMLGAALLLASCGPRPAAEVEKVELRTEVGDFGMLVNAIEITVSNPRSIKGLTAADFDLVNNVPGGYMNPATGAAYEPYEDDGIVVSTEGNVLRIEATPFSKAGRRGEAREMLPWELHCAIILP